MEWAWLIPSLSFIAFPLIAFWGKRLPGGGAPLAIAAIAAGFALFWVALLDFLAAPADTGPCVADAITGGLRCSFQRAWFNAGLPNAPGSVSLGWGMTIDPLALAMLGMVTLVALMVQIYSLGYMKGDPRFGWYYACHALFAASMLTLVLADSFLLLYVAWELVGACSYLLIGFWHERPAAREAAKKAFIVTRLGDVGLLLGILLLWREVGSFSMTEAFDMAHTGDMSPGVATASSLLILLGAMGKSAQFPFHVWLPDAMEGPTPVSALIHAATMVAAGVYLVARAFPIFLYSGDALTVVAVVGLVTALMASTIALTATDLKRILAYSTISHLGLMMLSLGAAGYTAALFHLLAHGFSKALLFLGAGSVLHSTEQQDIRHMGGLRRAMPLTAVLFSLGALSLGGIPVLSGFWSKDEVLAAVSHGLPPVFIVLALVTALLSALYMARAMFVVFFGRSQEGDNHGHPVHDAPLTMAAPMVLLGVLAAGFGFISFNWPGAFGGIGSFLYYHEPEGFHFTWWLAIVSTLLAVAAFALGYLVYVQRRLSLEGLRRSFAPLIQVVERKYYVDELYQGAVDRVVMVLSAFIAFFDRAVVNDVLVNGPANSARRLGVAMRLHVTGHVYSYALVMALGAAALAILWWWLVV